MKLETFNLKNSVYEDFRNKLFSMLKNRDVMPAKECIGKDYEILSAVVEGFKSQYITDPETGENNHEEIDNTKQVVEVLRISKREVPIKWTVEETLKAKFLIYDWDDDPVVVEAEE